MPDATPAPPVAYPPSLTEIERVELAHCLGLHFDYCGGPSADKTDQYVVICMVVNRILRRRAAVAR